MDPVTITATVITFATAVKDLVELGAKIQASFAQVSKNRRSAQRAAENVKDMIDEMVVFCEEHKDTIANMKEFTAALDALLKKLRLFETKILPLVPQRGGSWISVSFLRGWWNNNKVKDSILDLEGEIREVRRRYVMKSAMRTEVKLEVVHHDATRGFAEISHGLEHVRTDIHAIRVSTTTAPIDPTTLAISNERERNVMLFMRSAMSKSSSLLRPPDEVTEEVWTTVFIKTQVHYIEAEVAKMSTMRLFDQRDAEPFSVTLLTHDSMEISCLRRDVVRRLMALRDILSDVNDLQAISVRHAVVQLGTISSQLSVLGLDEESQLLLDWTIKLARALVSAPGLRGKAPHRASLALYLHRLSQHCGDLTRRRQALEESLAIIETLPSQDAAVPDTEIQVLRVGNLIESAGYAPNNESAITRLIQAIQLLENIFDIQILARVNSHGFTGDVVDPSYGVVKHVFSSSPKPVMMFHYADALRHLVVYMLRAGKFDNAQHLAHLCIALHRQILSVYGDAHQAWFANMLLSMCRGELAQCFTDIELLNLVDECAPLYRQLTQINPVYYSRRLLNILWQRAEVLNRLNRASDSVSTREEAIDLAVQITQDFRLQADAQCRLAQDFCNSHRFLDAARAMARIPAMFRDESHGSFYGYLSHDLLKTRHYKESAEAANNSIAIYRNLRPGVPAQEMGWTHGLISALSALAQSQIALGDHTRGISSLNESVVIASNVLNATVDTLPDSLEEYLGTFRTHVTVSSFHDKEFTIEPDYTPIQTLKRLAARHPQNEDVFKTMAYTQTYSVYHLYRIGRLRDALAYADQLLGALASRGEPAPDYASEVAAHITWIKARTLAGQGYTLLARLVIQNLRSEPKKEETEEEEDEIEENKAEDNGAEEDAEEGDEDKKEPEPEDDGNHYYTLMSRVYDAQLSVGLGDWAKGLEVAEQALEQSRSNSGGFHWRPILCLFGVAYAALYSRKYQRTMEVAGEGIELSANPEWVANENEDDIFIRPSLFAIMSSAKANTGNLDRAMDYAQQAVTLSLDIAEHKVDISATTAKHSLMETRGYLAEVLLATGEVTQAREICHERKVYFTERVENKDGDPRLGEYRDLAPVLRMLGVLCCHEGRHDEGEAAAQQLTEIIRRLGLTFPSLLEQVKIRLRYQASVPILRVLDEMTEKLSCDHQKGIKALFEI